MRLPSTLPSIPNINMPIADHTMSAALRGAITVLINSKAAPDDAGKGDNILPR